MACYMDEEEIYKCPTHPSKRRRTGICPTCLRDRLNTLCPSCAKVRPCECSPAVTSSSSSSFSFFSGVPSGDTEPTMRKSRSLAIPFLRSRSKYAPNLEFTSEKPPLPPAPTNQNIPAVPGSGSSRGKTTSLLSMFKKSKKVREEIEKEKEEVSKESNDFKLMMKRSRSVSVTLNSRAGKSKSAAGKTRGWHFPSPFRQSKTSRVLEEHQSAMCKV